MPEKKRFLSVKEICYIGIFVAIIAVCAQISLPLPGGVDFTLQTFGVTLAGMILGPKKGAIAVLVYILLGAAGVPVFARFRGGLGVVLGLTGGFILSFPVLAWFAGLGARGKTFILAAWLAAGTVVNLTVGMLWFAVVSGGTVAAAFWAAVTPFILPDMLKNIAVIIVGKGLQAVLVKAGLAVDTVSARRD